MTDDEAMREAAACELERHPSSSRAAMLNMFEAGWRAHAALLATCTHYHADRLSEPRPSPTTSWYGCTDCGQRVELLDVVG